MLSSRALSSQPVEAAAAEETPRRASLWTEEHEMIRVTTRRFVAEHINPHVDEWEKAGTCPAHEVFKKLGDLGLLGLTKPVEHGGGGLDFSCVLDQNIA